MLPVLYSERLVLRPRALGDLAQILAMDADPAVTRHVGGPPTDWAEYARRLAERIEACHPSGLGYWSFAARRAPEQFLGWASLVPYEGEVEIGWRLVPTVWGQGFATEAATRLLRHAFAELGLARVIATIAPGNDRSRRVAERAGMGFVGAGLYEGEPCMVYEALAASNAASNAGGGA